MVGVFDWGQYVRMITELQYRPDCCYEVESIFSMMHLSEELQKTTRDICLKAAGVEIAQYAITLLVPQTEREGCCKALGTGGIARITFGEKTVQADTVLIADKIAA